MTNYLNKLALECNAVIDSNNGESISTKIDELSLLLSKEKPNLYKICLHYFLVNLFSKKSKLANEIFDSWEETKCPENAIKAINHYRNSYELASKTEHHIKFEIQTNLANCLSTFGRDIEAIQLWLCDLLLIADAPFVSSDSKARALKHLANYINDDGHAYYYRREAYQLLKNLKNNIDKTTHNKLKEKINSNETENFLQKLGNYLSKQNRPHSLNQIPYKPEYDSEDEKTYSSS